MRRRAVFLDVDGVLLEPERTAAEWVRLVGDVLAPALGGEAAAWGRANAALFPVVFEDQARWFDPDPMVSERNLVTELLRAQCAFVGVPYPGDDAAFALGRELDLYVCRNADCAYPATIAVIRALAARRKVHTATGNPSWRVEALLEQWGVRDLVGVLVGKDLVGVMKATEDFYHRAFAMAGVAPADAIVVDDASSHLRRARAVGARTVLVDPGGTQPTGDHVDSVIGNVAELPGVVEALDA
jgi:FMN phosphatase YigB (HAD superfamily)